MSGEATVPSIEGHVPRISSTSRLGLLPPLCSPFRLGVVEEVTSGVGRRGLERANISLGVGDGKGIEPVATGEAGKACLIDILSTTVFAGDIKASGVNKLNC